MSNKKDKTDKQEKKKELEQYKILIEARNFHTGQFSKWSTYFYVATGALFVGYYTINNNPEPSISSLILDYFY